VKKPITAREARKIALASVPKSRRVKPSARDRILQIVDLHCRDYAHYKVLEEIPIRLDEVEDAAFERGMRQAARMLANSGAPSAAMLIRPDVRARRARRRGGKRG
jgi:hypothetical protein